jgi:hypothetical protein
MTYQAILQEARDQGVQQGLLTAAFNMLKAEMDVSQISKLTGLAVEQIQSLKATRETQPSQKDPLASFIGAVSHGSLTQQLDVELYGD